MLNFTIGLIIGGLGTMALCLSSHANQARYILRHYDNKGEIIAIYYVNKDLLGNIKIPGGSVEISEESRSGEAQK